MQDSQIKATIDNANASELLDLLELTTDIETLIEEFKNK